jgi:site-specific recombinase XerD
MAYLVHSDRAVFMNDYYYDQVPTMLSRWHRPVDVMNRYCRYLTRTRNVRPSTRDETMKTLTNFVSFLERRELENILQQRANRFRVYRRAVRDADILVSQSDHELLEAYRNSDENKGVGARVINRKLGRIFHFFIWAQRAGIYRGIIGDGAKFKIHAWWEVRKGRYKRKVVSSDLLFRGALLVARKSGIPTDLEMEAAYVEASKSNFGCALRDTLLLRLSEVHGLRGAECLSLKCSDLPSQNDLQRPDVQEQGWLITVTGKGQKKRDIYFQPEIVQDLLQYIDVYRADIMRRNPRTKEHEFIFISHTTGEVLNSQYISRRLSALFGEAKKRRSGSSAKLSHHRVRAKCATEMLRTLVDDFVEKGGNLKNVPEEQILTVVAEALGHADLNTLKFYLDFEISRRIGRTRKKTCSHGKLTTVRY